MICTCTLAGTAACKTCFNNPGSIRQPYIFVTRTTTVIDTPQITYVPERTCERITLGLEREREIATVSWICSACGKHIGRDDNYCPNCGARVTPKNSETTQKVVSE